MTSKFNEKIDDEFFDINIINFLSNYYVKETLIFSKDRDAILNLYPELKKPTEIYFLTNLNVLGGAGVLNFFYERGEQILGCEMDFESSIIFEEFNKNFKYVEERVMDFNKGLGVLAKNVAYIHDKKMGDLLVDNNALKQIHEGVISKENFKELQEDYWKFYESFIKVVPDLGKEHDSYNSYFNELCTGVMCLGFTQEVLQKAKELNLNESEVEDILDNKDSFNIPEKVNFLFNAEKLYYNELQESLDVFKENYYDRVVEYKLKTYF